MMTAIELREFEQDLASLFEQGKIPYPVHLSGGNEEPLIDIFKQIKSEDWVFSTHRSHYHALLKGVPPELVKEEILKGHSITLNFAKYHFFSSAIVGGILPIAVGVAMTGQRCWVFVGDMAGATGILNECFKYAVGHSLPITYVIEDNGFSVDTPTKEVWGKFSYKYHDIIQAYRYNRIYPHQGSGKWVIF